MSAKRKYGLYWIGRRIAVRPVLFLGFVVFLLGALYFPSRVFFVRVEGNFAVPAKKIMDAAENCGIGFGASRRMVRSEKVKNALLASVPELQWAGVNTAGCVAVISVREKTLTQVEKKGYEVTSILADRDGYILSATVTEGNLLVQPGQAVQKGQMLVSGYTDCGTYLRAVRSQAEILARTNRCLEVVMPGEYQKKAEEQTVKRKYSFLFRKKRINLWKDSGILDSSCGRMYEEYYITLPGGFALPFALCVDTFYRYETYSVQVAQERAEAWMTDFADRYLMLQMVAGRVREKNQSVKIEDGVFKLSGEYLCEEMIGRERQEQIGDTNGKSG